MELDFKRIERIAEIRGEKESLTREWMALAAPTLNDVGLVRETYRIFTGILDGRGPAPDSGSVLTRKKFIFIVLYLFSPDALAGGKMRPGLRGEMSRVLGIKSANIISRNCEDVVFLYRHYRGFRDDARSLFRAVTERLEAEGLMGQGNLLQWRDCNKIFRGKSVRQRKYR